MFPVHEWTQTHPQSDTQHVDITDCTGIMKKDPISKSQYSSGYVQCFRSIQMTKMCYVTEMCTEFILTH